MKHCRGNNLHEVWNDKGEEFLVSMPTKFRKHFYIKKGKKKKKYLEQISGFSSIDHKTFSWFPSLSLEKKFGLEKD